MNRDEIKKRIRSFVKQQKMIQTQLGEFKLQDLLGEGGTALVYSASYEDEENYKYAVKFLACDNPDDSTCKRFKQAYINLSSIQHLGVILPHFYFGELEFPTEKESVGRIPYSIMVKAEKTLREYMDGKTDKLETVESVFDKIGARIQRMHDAGIVHRDLKPENIFLKDDDWFVGDCDIARFDSSHHNLVITQKMDRLANYRFAAPEQIESGRNTSVTAASDWYAFGQILIWLITGNPFSRGIGSLGLSKYGDGFGVYDDLLESLIQHDPSMRLQTFDEIKAHMNPSSTSGQRSPLDFSDLDCFEKLVRKYTCRVSSGQIMLKRLKVNQVEEVLSFLSENCLKMSLWWSQGHFDYQIDNGFSRDQINPTHWVFGDIEVKVKDVWIYRHSSSWGRSLVILETDSISPSGVYGDAENEDTEEVGVVDGCYISQTEYANGWVETQDGPKEISPSAYQRYRYLRPSIFFIAPKRGPFHYNMDLLDEVFNLFKESHNLNQPQILAKLELLKLNPHVSMYN